MSAEKKAEKEVSFFRKALSFLGFSPSQDMREERDAPLPAWEHYDIVSIASQKVQEELKKQNYQGYLIGLSVGYVLGDADEKHEMAFGIVEPDESNRFPDAKNPLEERFLLELHNEISGQIHQRMPEVFSDINVELRVNVSGSFLLSIIVCRFVQAGECGQGHTDRRKCIQFQGGSWTCLHVQC